MIRYGHGHIILAVDQIYYNVLFYYTESKSLIFGYLLLDLWFP